MRKERLISAILAVVCLLNVILFLPSGQVRAESDEASYWRGYSDTYFYDNVLTEQERELYDLFDGAFEEALLNDEYYNNIYVDLSSYRFDDSEETMYYVNDVLILVIHCNPQYFFWWISVPSYGEIDGQNCLKGYILGVAPDFRSGYDRAIAKEEVRKLLDSYIDAVPKDALPEEKEKMIHDLMCERITYGDYILPSGTSHTQGIYSALKGSTVCQGYADLFQCLMCKLGIECIFTAGTGHAWNYIKLHGYWFLVDVTADDCFEPCGYVRYNSDISIYKTEGFMVRMVAGIDPAYDQVDDDPLGDYSYTNYSSRYIKQGNETFFILNDIYDSNGLLAVCISSDTSKTVKVKYNDRWYKVVNYSDPGSSSYVPVVEKKDFSDFVERLYVKALGRDSEKAGKDFWCDKVRKSEMSGAECARGFLYSEEFMNKGLDDSEFLKTLYRTFFDRNAEEDPEGFSYWMGQIQSIGRTQVIESFINSEEWCDLCVSYGVSSGASYAVSSVATADSVSFSKRLYTECLGRTPEAGGLRYWSLGLARKDLTGSQAAREFFYSDEFKGLGLDDKEYVIRLYRTFMGRDPEKEGFDHWVGALENGMSRDDVFTFFCNCPEFADICKEYSISA